MPIVSITNLHKAFGPDLVFDKLNLTLYRNEKVGLIGPNGSGKTTVLKLILGTEIPEIGTVNTRRNLAVGYLPQEPHFNPDKTVIEQMHAGLEHIFTLQRKLNKLEHSFEKLRGPELESALKEYDRFRDQFTAEGGYEYETKIKTILAGVELDEELTEKPIAQLSGGQLSRLGLAQVLMTENDLLLLDEPTNHLDLHGREWLEKYLQKYDHAALIISHDRYFLDKTVSKIIEITNHAALTHSGNYSTFLENKNKTALQQQREYEKRQQMVNDTRDFIARNKDQEGMRGTARGRKKRLERLLKENPDYLEKPQNLQPEKLRIAFDNHKKKSQLVIRSQSLAKSFGPLKLFENISFDLLAGERLAITGPNGTGKSTLVKLALDRLCPTEGSITIGKNVTVGYLDQHGNELHPDNTPLAELARTKPDLSEQQIRDRLAAIGFKADDVFKKNSDLSGGQQNRLALCKLMLKGPQLLILDEPTNHLDIPTREALENALMEFDGTILAVSHDRYFLDKIASRLLVIGNDTLGNRQTGQHEFISGNYSIYAQILSERNVKHQQKQQAKKKQQNKSQSVYTTPAELKEFNPWSIEKIEHQITALETEADKMQQHFGNEDIYKNPDKYEQLKQDYNQKLQRIELLYRAYERKISK